MTRVKLPVNNVLILILTLNHLLYTSSEIMKCTPSLRDSKETFGIYVVSLNHRFFSDEYAPARVRQRKNFPHVERREFFVFLFSFSRCFHSPRFFWMSSRLRAGEPTATYLSRFRKFHEASWSDATRRGFPARSIIHRNFAACNGETPPTRPKETNAAKQSGRKRARD